MTLPWCEKCLKEKQVKQGYINTSCLACKWQYVGQEAFDRKSDLFEDDTENKSSMTPYKYWGNLIDVIGVEII